MKSTPLTDWKLGELVMEAAFAHTRYTAQQIDAALAVLVGRIGLDAVRARCVHERHERTGLNFPEHKITLDGVVVWVGGWDVVEVGFRWRESWLDAGVPL